MATPATVPVARPFLGVGEISGFGVGTVVLDVEVVVGSVFDEAESPEVLAVVDEVGLGELRVALRISRPQ